jgi:DNA topoisomerase-2
MFCRKNRDWLDDVLERSIIRHHRSENKSAVQQHKKTIGNRKRIEGLLDATSRNRFECILIITEGDSAASNITEVRNPKTMASLPLSGKINNTYGLSIAQLLKLKKVADLITAIGLVPGEKPLRSSLRYGKLIIATDADYDGGDIFTLIINLLYTYWPDLFSPEYQPFVYRLTSPNVCVSKGKKRIHYPTLQEYEKNKRKHNGWDVEYFKGLGSMQNTDWKMVLADENNLIPIIDDGYMKDMLKFLFSPDADARKEWLSNPTIEETNE